MNNLLEKINHLPVSLAGRMAYFLLPYRRKLIRSNMSQVFGNQLSVSDINHLMKAFYSHLMLSVKETIQLRFMSEKKLRERVEVKGHEHLLNIAAQQKGVLILTAHVGNWEFAPLGGILNFKAFQGQFHFIRRTLGSKWLENILFKRYYRAGLNVIPKKKFFTASVYCT